MDDPVTLMMQNTLLVKNDQAGNQDAKKKRMLEVVRASARRRWRIVRAAVAVGWGCGFEIGGAVGLERGGRRGRDGRERWRVIVRRWRMGGRGRKRVVDMGCKECSSYR